MEELNTVLQEFKFLVGSVVAFAGVFMGLLQAAILPVGEVEKKK